DGEALGEVIEKRCPGHWSARAVEEEQRLAAPLSLHGGRELAVPDRDGDLVLGHRHACALAAKETVSGARSSCRRGCGYQWSVHPLHRPFSCGITSRA